MSSALPWGVIISYSLFSLFIFCQQYHLKYFRGASRMYPALLSLTGMVGLLTGIVFLVFYAFKVAWWAPVGIMVISFLFQMLVHPLISHFAPWIGMVGLVGWPVCAVIMFMAMPGGGMDDQTRSSLVSMLLSEQAANASVFNPSSDCCESYTNGVTSPHQVALQFAEKVEPRLLNKIYPQWGDHYRDEYLRGLMLTLEAHKNNDPAKGAAGSKLLLAWLDWYEAHFEDIKSSMPLDHEDERRHKRYLRGEASAR